MAKRSSLRLHGGHGSFTTLAWLTFVIFIFVVALSTLISESREPDSMVLLEDPNDYWSTVRSYDRVLVYFAQSGCPGCKKIDPAIERFASEQSDIKVIKAWLDSMIRNDPQSTFRLLSSLEVQGTPTLILYERGVEKARHVSTFGLGDQYQPLLEFVEAGFKGEYSGGDNTPTTAINQGLENTLTVEAITKALTGGLILGLIAALSPCSLPMVVLFSSQSTDEIKKFKSYLSNLAAIAAIAIGGGSLLSLLYITSTFLPINPYIYTIYLAGAFVLAWGILSLRGKDPMIALSRRARFLLPAIGLQCSLPFLIIAITMSSQAPHLVAASSLMFASGYGLPYALAGAMGSAFSARIERIASSPAMKYVQGLLLIVGGVYVIYSNLPY
ncbi:MAG: thioredoxin domain-containing protein [Aeropyrum sp.]|nr:thioredoxin domain-containing protein [Aeropyrum sp.]MCE4615553.1 thioredoxin domain-containing protein [Aeropyrum sp.]